jgi:hypothetical protein
MGQFLGIDAINVLKEYINDQLVKNNLSTTVITIQAYRFYENGTQVSAPMAGTGGFNIESGQINYPSPWNSLSNVINNVETNYGSLESALSIGSIWMSTGIALGNGAVEDWSTPMKVSGQNGAGVSFQYSYNENAIESERYSTPRGVTAANPKEYVWTKLGVDGEYQGPALWAVWAESGKDIKWRYCITHEDDVNSDGIPNIPGSNAAWTYDLPVQSITQEYPYMWHSYQRITAGGQLNPDNWSTPVLFGHYGKDGSVPDYIQNIYCKGTDSADAPGLPGIVAPSKPVFESNKPVDFYIKDGWVSMPDSNDTIWWQCGLMVNGHKSIVENIGAVTRYNALDGVAKPGTFTKYLYSWSADQTQPKLDISDLINNWQPVNWYETPDYDIKDGYTGDVNSSKSESSLWMISGVASGLDENGYPMVDTWTSPIKLSGPRGPISYDYRIVYRYMIGNVLKPQYSFEDYSYRWTEKIPSTTEVYPYLYARTFLARYEMKYDEKTGNVIPNESKQPEIIEDYGEIRLSGLNADDSSKNTVDYITEGTDIIVTSFNKPNYYVCNSSTDVTYNIAIDAFTFANGNTAKFSNIGTGNMILNAGSYTFIGSNTTAKTITLAPQDNIELVSYIDNGKQSFLVMGKSLI